MDDLRLALSCRKARASAAAAPSAADHIEMIIEIVSSRRGRQDCKCPLCRALAKKCAETD
jgi:hypothetical protein